MSKTVVRRNVAKMAVMIPLILLLVFLLVLLAISLVREKELQISCTQKLCNETFLETYPQDPELEDCEKMKTCGGSFCFADVAEITGNLTICERICDYDIKIFCVAKVTIDSAICSKIKDIGLKDACLDSIQMKKNWTGK